MSGQPYKKFTDVNKFRNEYLDALNIRASLDDMNLQANKNFKSTGSLPAVSQMKDTRTTTEILADTEKLKVDIVTALTKISNPQFAAAVVQRIISSPINQDNSLLIFTAQRVNDLVDKLSRIYAYGIKGDSNDVQQIVNFLTNMYNDKNILASTTQDFLNRYNGPNYGSFGYSSSDALQNSKSVLIKAKGTLNTLYNLINTLHDGGVNGYIRMDPRGIELLQGHMNRIVNIDTLMDKLVRLIPGQNTLISIDEAVSEIINSGIDPSDQIMSKILSYKDFLSYGIPSSANVSLTEKKLIILVTTLQNIINKRYYNGLNTMMDNITQSLDNFKSILMPSEKWDEESLNRLIIDVVNLMDFQPTRTRTRTANTAQPTPQPNQNSIMSSISSMMPDYRKYALDRLIDSENPEGIPTITIDEFLNPSKGYVEIAKKFIVDRMPDYTPYLDYLSESDIYKIISGSMSEFAGYANKILSNYDTEVENRIRSEFGEREEPQPAMMPDYRKYAGYANKILSDYDTEVENRIRLEFPEDIPTITIDEFLNPRKGYIEIAKKFIVDRMPDYGAYLDYLSPKDIFNVISKNMSEFAKYYDTEVENRIRLEFGEREEPQPDKEAMYNQQLSDLEMGRPIDRTGLRQRYIRKPAGNGIKQRKRGRPKGSGIKKKYSDIVKESINTDKGIDEDRRFIKFGKYLINNKKLNDGVLAVKRPSGNNIIEFPSQHISSNMQNVIKTMIGGGMPKYEDLNKLSEPEKIYLHKLSSKANIIDKFSIPTPSKSEYEKDIHDFEVMKGEIMSGNDNKDMIKKFKMHIMKLSKTGALPKREVAELLEELLLLGY